ncbi:unnamed protein product [Boreogadus saida]
MSQGGADHLALEKEELRIHLQASKEAQRQLTAEDSLAVEIEGTMRKELSVDEETIFQDQRTSQRRVFQTVRSVNTLTARAAASSSSPIPGSGLSPLVMTAQPFQSAQGDDPRPAPRPPGPPAGDHLSDAIRRLSLRRHNFLCERKFFQAERKTEALGGVGAGAGLEEGEGGASGRCSPAGSGRSSCSNLSELSAASGAFKSFLPERLQIVKPMEGSLTLHHWQQLAQPHLATLLDPRPGVVTKGFRPLSHDRDPPADDGPPPSYRLDDPEEEDEEEGGRGRAGGAEKGSTERGKPPAPPVRCSPLPREPPRRATRRQVPSGRRARRRSPPRARRPSCRQSNAVVVALLVPTTSSRLPPSAVQHPGKCQSSTYSTYTVTTCRILHPNDITQVTSSSQPMWSVAPPDPPSSLRTRPSTPRPALALDNFLASRPAELFLQDVYGLNLGRAPPHPDLPSPRPDAPPPKGSGGAGGGGGGPPDPVSVGLVERLCRLGFGRGQQRRGRLSSFTQPPSSGAGKH